MRSSAPRGSDSARWMPSASSRVRVAARRHALSVTASGTRTLGSSSRVRPRSRRIGAALTLRLSTHAMRCGSTQPCTDDAMTARPWPLPIPSDCPGASAPGSNRITRANNPTREIPPTRIKRDWWCGHAVQEYSNHEMGLFSRAICCSLHDDGGDERATRRRARAPQRGRRRLRRESSPARLSLSFPRQAAREGPPPGRP
jgi:hypothetical protein